MSMWSKLNRDGTDRECWGEWSTNVDDQLHGILNFLGFHAINLIKNTLEKLYVKSPNEVFAQHLLATRRQQCSETLDVFFQNLRKLSKDCKFKAVSAEQYRDEMLRDAFINGLLSPEIRQRLLENDKLTMDSAFDKASSMDVAQRNASAYSSPVSHMAAASAPPPSPPPSVGEWYY